MDELPKTHGYDAANGQLLGRAAVVVGCVRRIESMTSSIADSLVSQVNPQSNDLFHDIYCCQQSLSKKSPGGEAGALTHRG